MIEIVLPQWLSGHMTVEQQVLDSVPESIGQSITGFSKKSLISRNYYILCLIRGPHPVGRRVLPANRITL